MIPLFTSIPPRISRQAPDGSEIGREYAQQCIASWRKSGFHPITLNADDETVSELVQSEGIERLIMARNAREQFGRPLVYMDDFIRAARSRTDGVIAIVNSDIMLDVAPGTLGRISAIQPGCGLFSRRSDIQELASRHGKEYAHGCDFFVCHTRDLARYANMDFVFGMPWWDHYFLVHMLLGGTRPLRISEPFVFHLVHEEAWERTAWRLLGERFVSAIRSEASELGKELPVAADFARRLEQAFLGSNTKLPTRARSGLRRATSRGRKQNEIQALHRVTALNMAWLNELQVRDA